MQQCSTKTCYGKYLVAIAKPKAAQPNTNANYANVFDAVICQQLFKVMLNDCQHYTIYSCNYRNGKNKITNGNHIGF